HPKNCTASWREHGSIFSLERRPHAGCFDWLGTTPTIVRPPRRGHPRPAKRRNRARSAVLVDTKKSFVVGSEPPRIGVRCDTQSPFVHPRSLRIRPPKSHNQCVIDSTA